MTRTIVVTGSTRGIGRGLADAFLERGHNVVVVGRTDESTGRAVDELKDRFDGARIAGIACDVASAEELQRLWDGAVERFGVVDIWINNAGISLPRKPIWEQTHGDLEQIVGTNVVGTLVGTQIALRGMLAQEHGRVYVMHGFGSGGETRDGMAAYGATKRAVAYVPKALVKDLGKDSPVHIGSISPGIVATDLLEGDYEPGSPAWEKAKKVFNILGDRVEDVTPWLADQVLTDDKQGSRIRWLTKPKAFARFAMAPFRKDRDIFADR